MPTPDMSLVLRLLRAGPGRDILSQGWTSLSAGRPDMNSLVGLGATASFAVSCVAAALPRLGWKTFFEEPAMLLGELPAWGPACRKGGGRGRGWWVGMLEGGSVRMGHVPWGNQGQDFNGHFTSSFRPQLLCSAVVVRPWQPLCLIFL
jgi:hypothetical protein